MKEYEYQKNDRWAAVKRRRDLVVRMQQAKSLIDAEQEQNRSTVSASLEIGEPNDKYEQEADAVAKKVVHGGDADITTQENNSSLGISMKEEDTGSLMAKSEGGTLKGTEQLQSKLDSSKGSGQALDDKTQSEMGGKMNADLSDVKIHTDSKAHEMSEGINAKAFTHGQDIYFKQGNFDTSSTDGKELLAHELTHTVQQKEGMSRKIQREPDDYPNGHYSFSITIPSVMNGIEWIHYVEMQAYNIKDPKALDQINHGRFWGIGVDRPITKEMVNTRVEFTVDANLYRSNMAILHPGYDYSQPKKAKGTKGTVGQTKGGSGDDQGGIKNNGGKKDGQQGGVKGGVKDGQVGGQKGGVKDGQVGGTGEKDRDQQYNELSAEDKKKVTDETNKRYYKRAGTTAPIKEGDEPHTQLWNDIRDEVLAERDKLGNVSDRLRPLVGDLSKVPADKKEQYFRIITKLESLSDEDIQVLSAVKSKLPAANLDAMEKFLDLYIANIETKRKQIAEAMQKQQAPTADQTKQADKPLDKQVSEYWQSQDTSGWDTMSVPQREDLARKQMNDIAQIEMKYMAEHPVQTANEMAKGMTLMNANEVAEGAANDMKEMQDGDANAWARFAAGAGYGSKMSGWVAAIAVVCIVISMATGVGEIAALVSLAVYAMATSIVLSTAESQLRIKAAGQQNTAEGAQQQINKGASALTNAIVSMAMLIFMEGARVTIKAMPEFIKSAKNMTASFREKLAALIDSDKLTEEMSKPLFSDLELRRASLLEMAANAKAELAAMAQLLEGLTAEDFVAKLEAGDKPLMDLTGITQDKVAVYRQLLGSTEGKNAIGSMIKSLHDGLVTEGPGIVDQTIKPFIDDIDAYKSNITAAQTAGEARSATTKYEASLGDENLNKRVQGQQEQAMQDYLKKAQEKLKAEQEQAENNQKSSKEDPNKKDKFDKKSSIDLDLYREYALKLSDKVKENSKFKKSKDYHGLSDHNMSDEIVADIIANPDAIFFISKSKRLIYLKGGDIAVVEAYGSGKGNTITAYGSSGIKGASGKAALGGLESDPGAPVTEEMILEGKIPAGKGRKGFIEPGVKLYP
ncbi:MAG: hypothetical protein JWO09_2309 [Bacteroidetes bacterium]|nr:hypothetical protein [Bacteroidota bacterium]